MPVLSGAMISKGRTLEKLSPALYAPECVEGTFCELRLDAVFRSSGVGCSPKFAYPRSTNASDPTPPSRGQLNGAAPYPMRRRCRCRRPHPRS